MKKETSGYEKFGEYAVMWASANMPGKCWGRYGRVAVVRLSSPSSVPRMISTRDKAVSQIVSSWERQHRGYDATSTRTAFARSLLEATEQAKELAGLPD